MYQPLDPAFQYRNDDLFAEDVRLADIAASVGTPAYVYSSASIARQYRRLRDALNEAAIEALICYAVKANSNQAVLTTLRHMGAGSDVVSMGEMSRALAAGIPADRIVFAGVGKTADEMKAALEAGILQFNVESEPELVRLQATASAMGKFASVALRINPDVDAKTHAKITTGTSENKFGVPIDHAREIAMKSKDWSNVAVEAISMHIGSQILDLQPYEQAFERMSAFAKDLIANGLDLKRLDVGGGLGIAYSHEAMPPADQVEKYAAMIKKHFADFKLPLVLEPGRYMVGNAGLLLTEVVYVKQAVSKRFLILDSAMNDLIRPAMYEATHQVLGLKQSSEDHIDQDLVGPVCESGDTFAKNFAMPPVAEGDLLAFQSAGAYSAVMASTYNTRLMVPEVLVKGSDFAVIRKRQTLDELIAQDQTPDWL